MSESVNTPEDLARLLEGKSDGDINAWVTQEGADTILRPIFEGMQARFLPDKAAGKSAVIQYDVTTAEGVESWQVDVKDGTCTVAKGADKEASVTLALALPDFLRLVTGKLNGVQAFMSGKLKVRGDMMLAQTMQGWFDQA